jgi:hypothetical protein
MTSRRSSGLLGRIEELRWRIRYRTEHRDTALDGLTSALVDELLLESRDLLDRVENRFSTPKFKR